MTRTGQILLMVTAESASGGGTLSLLGCFLTLTINSNRYATCLWAQSKLFFFSDYKCCIEINGTYNYTLSNGKLSDVNQLVREAHA